MVDSGGDEMGLVDKQLYIKASLIKHKGDFHNLCSNGKLEDN